MRASRLLTILMTLQLRGRVTAQTLADQLEVSRRTIYRDVDELSAAGVPIYAERGSSGGFALLDGFKTELTGLTAGETEALMFAGVPAAAADLGVSGAADSVRLKLLAALPDARRFRADRMGQRFHLDVIDWYQRRTVPTHLRTIAAAVWTERRVALEYESWTRSSRLTVDPLGLILKAGRWYLMAHVRDGERIYRLDKVRKAQVLDETFARPAGFELAKTWRESVDSFEASLKRWTAQIKVSSTCLDRLDRLGADIAERVLASEPDGDGWHSVVVPIESVSHAAGLLLGFGSEIEIVAPDELREEILRRATGVIEMYNR